MDPALRDSSIPVLIMCSGVHTPGATLLISPSLLYGALLPTTSL
jgi:hypothetical protein